jgi:hypothetical protein
MVVEHIKAKKILDDVLNGKITSLDEVIEKMGNDPYNELWAKTSGSIIQPRHHLLIY